MLYYLFKSDKGRYNHKISMFGYSAPASGDNGPVPPPNADSQKIVKAIRDQTDGTPPHMVYVIDIVSVRFGGYFTTEVRT